MKAIFKREFRSYFTSPIGYVVAAIILFFEGLMFSALYMSGEPAVYQIFSIIPTVMVFILPVLTMRLLSEDRKLKVDQALLTSPVSVTGVVMGKFFAAFLVFALPLTPSIIFQIIVSSMVSVNWLFYLNAFIGLLLLGGALISIGMFISSLTESSVISCILTLVIFLLIMLSSSLVSLTGSELLTSIVDYLAIIDIYSEFTDGVLRITNVVYLLSLTSVFCFLSVRAVEKRRWA